MLTLPAAVVPFAVASDDLTGLSGWVLDVVDALGAVGLGVVVAIENLFPPIPSEAILPLGGFLAARGDLTLPSVLLWSTAGSVFGALVLYGLGSALGEHRLGGLLGLMPLVSPDDVERSVAWFHDHGEVAVLFGRMVPLVRSLVSVPAGAERMPLVRFVAYTTLGSGAWNTLLVGAGWLLGEQWETVGEYTRWLDIAFVVAVLGGLGYFVWTRLRDRSTRQQS